MVGTRRIQSNTSQDPQKTPRSPPPSIPPPKETLESMGKPLIYEILEKPATTAIIAINTLIWLYIQKHGITYAHVGLSYPAFVDGHHWRLLTSAFSHISPIHLVFNMSALWSLAAAEQLLGLRYYLHYTLLLALLSGLLNVAVYHLLIHKFGFHYFRSVTAVGYSCVVFGWMTVLAVKQPDTRLSLFGVLSLPISFAPFESLVFTSIIVPQASFVGHLSGIVVGYLIGWGVIDGMDDYWAVSILGWVAVAVVYSLKMTGTVDFPWIEIESVAEEELPMVGVVGGNGRRLQIGSDIV